MKHPTKPTVLLITYFLLAQLIGLGLLAAESQTQINPDTGELEVKFSETISGPRPDTTGAQSFGLLAGGVLIGTLILLLLVKYNMQKLWKLWYGLAVWLAIALSLGAVLSPLYAYLVAALLTGLKLVKKTSLIHNITEILVYTGIAFLVAPLFDVLWASILLLAIAVYDAYAVWKSKHMISLAQFQTQSSVFAGLQIPYHTNKPPSQKNNKKQKTKKANTHIQATSAILGGGDIAFPLIFSGAILQWLLTQAISLPVAFGYTAIISVTATLSLSALFYFSKQDRFYPAMPFLTTGCLVGLGIVALLI